MYTTATDVCCVQGIVLQEAVRPPTIHVHLHMQLVSTDDIRLTKKSSQGENVFHAWNIFISSSDFVAMTCILYFKTDMHQN